MANQSGRTRQFSTCRLMVTRPKTGWPSTLVRTRKTGFSETWAMADERVVFSPRARAPRDQTKEIEMMATQVEVDKQHELDQLSINALRFLAVDGVQKANSGHPGAPLGCAPIAYLLFHKIMKHDPADPKWCDSDRFVFSNGHASMLLYGSLHLSGYNLPLEQLKQFRQWGSETPEIGRASCRERV